MPVSGGGSSSSASNTQIRFHLPMEAQKNVTHLEAQKLALAEEAVAFYKRSPSPRVMPRGPVGLQAGYVEYLAGVE